MLSLSEFITLWLGQANVGDTDANKGECVGLVEKWTDNLNLPHTWGNANQLLADANPSFFDVIHNNPQDLNQFPVAGDVVTWSIGVNGHCGIVIDANGKEFHTFEQNNPIGSPPKVAWHDYARVIGWLHPKTTVNSTPSPVSETNSTVLPTDDANALLVLKSHFPTSTDQQDQPFGNLEGYANTLTQDAYRVWKNSFSSTTVATPAVVITPTADLTPEQAGGFLAWLKQALKIG